ncbi:MAG: ABC transporter ATP-binding protein [Candidatus Erginobacter occultus]|nr:ABC transporter ATP-binding protein [Candidatus Erginobacter occultus]
MRRGEFIGLAGPNGSGKTTLVRVISSVLPPRQGQLHYRGRPFGEWPPGELARLRAVVPQNRGGEIDLPVEDLVLLGRLPYFRPLQWRAARADREAVARALAATATESFRKTNFGELSGGEQQRVLIAIALAQEPELLILDEPTLHLDLGYQQEIFRLLRRLHREGGMTILAVLHDLNLASVYCDRLVFLQEGKIWKDGPAKDLITRENLSQLYRARLEVIPHPETGRPLFFPSI